MSGETALAGVIDDENELCLISNENSFEVQISDVCVRFDYHQLSSW